MLRNLICGKPGPAPVAIYVAFKYHIVSTLNIGRITPAVHIFAILIPIVDLVVDLRELSVGVIYRIVAICNAFIKETES